MCLPQVLSTPTLLQTPTTSILSSIALHSALKAYHENQPATPEGESKQLLSQLHDTMGAAGSEEERWRQSKIASDRKAYQEEASKKGDGVAMDTGGGTDTLRSGRGMGYSELVANMETPTQVEDFKTRLKHIGNKI